MPRVVSKCPIAWIARAIECVPNDQKTNNNNNNNWWRAWWILNGLLRIPQDSFCLSVSHHCSCVNGVRVQLGSTFRILVVIWERAIQERKHWTPKQNQTTLYLNHTTVLRDIGCGCYFGGLHTKSQSQSLLSVYRSGLYLEIFFITFSSVVGRVSIIGIVHWYLGCGGWVLSTNTLEFGVWSLSWCTGKGQHMLEHHEMNVECSRSAAEVIIINVFKWLL